MICSRTVTSVHRLRLEICTIFVNKHKKRRFQGWQKNYNVQLQLVGGGGGGEVEGMGEELIPPRPKKKKEKSSTVLSEPKFGLYPNQKFLDPPLIRVALDRDLATHVGRDISG